LVGHRARRRLRTAALRALLGTFAQVEPLLGALVLISHDAHLNSNEFGAFSTVTDARSPDVTILSQKLGYFRVSAPRLPRKTALANKIVGCSCNPPKSLSSAFPEKQ
jgi:hypothetical protein